MQSPNDNPLTTLSDADKKELINKIMSTTAQLTYDIIQPFSKSLNDNVTHLMKKMKHLANDIEKVKKHLGLDVTPENVTEEKIEPVKDTLDEKVRD